MNWKGWQQLLDHDPRDWTTRLILADWLEERGKTMLAYAQRYMAGHQKCAGPPCHTRARPGEFSWFDAGQYGVRWYGVIPEFFTVHARWTLPPGLFTLLHGYQLRGSHNDYARSYIDRERAESALAHALDIWLRKEAA